MVLYNPYRFFVIVLSKITPIVTFIFLIFMLKGKPFNKFREFWIVLLILMVAGCGSGGGGGGDDTTTTTTTPTTTLPDTTPPSAINDIFHVPGTRGTITWTAPGDDGNVGTASSYDVRIWDQPIDNDLDFNNASLVLNAPSPNPAPTKEQLTIPGLDIGKTYYVAIKTTDSSGNSSALSTSFSFISSQKSLKRSGKKNLDRFGHSIAKAGDINGDGIPDFIVGAPTNETSGFGSINVFFGDTDIKSTPNIKLESSNSGEQFGFSVAGVGDVNGDGCDDIIVGANKFDENPLTNSGVVYIYYGSGGGSCPTGIGENSPPDFPPSVTIKGVSDNGEFGYAVAALGDINNDNISDFIVGAPFTNSNQGKAYVFFGNNSSLSQLISTDAGLILSGDNPGDLFGFSVSGNGDIDGDGVGDLVIGADKRENAFKGGSAYVFYGAMLPLLTDSGTALDADVEFSRVLLTTDQFGCVVAITGDMNGDSKSDVVVGAPLPDTIPGRVYVFYSGPGFVSKNAFEADVTLFGTLNDDRFGEAIADAGDINLDGFSDLIVGASQGNPSSIPNNGMAYIFYGGPNLIGNINATDLGVLSIQGENSLDQFGRSVIGIGDTNGDGYDEIAIGARLNDQDVEINDDTGAIYILR
jgi:hypothetical protein